MRQSGEPLATGHRACKSLSRFPVRSLGTSGSQDPEGVRVKVKCLLATRSPLNTRASERDGRRARERDGWSGRGGVVKNVWAICI